MHSAGVLAEWEGMNETIMKEFPDYLLQSEGINIALLSQILSPINELRASAGKDGVTLTRIIDGAVPQKFAVFASEMDALVNVWLTWKEQEEHRQLMEARRLEKAREDAFKIAENCSEISIYTVPDASDVWVVTLGKAKYSDHDYDECSYGPDELLQNVQSAKEDWDREQQVKANVEKAHKVVALIEEASIDAEGKHYWITFYGKRRWSESDDLYATLCEMANEHISDLLNAHPYIELEKISKKTAEQKAVWAIRYNGQERTAQGLNEVLTAIDECIDTEKRAALSRVKQELTH